MTYEPDFFATAIRMFSALLLVLGIFLGSFYVLRRLLKRDGVTQGTSLMRTLDKTYLGVKKSVTLVAVCDKILVLGVTNDRISLLSEIDDPDSVVKLKQTGSGPPMSFKNHLGRLLSKGREGGIGKDTSST